MRSLGLSIPIPLEHQPEAKPLTKAERAAKNLLNNAGWIDRYVMQGDELFSLCDIDESANPGILAKLPKTIRYTSPWLTSFTDGDGRKWEGVIGHLALTSRPRITRQQPFPDMVAALSLTKGTEQADPKKVSDKGLFLSRAGLLLPDAKGVFQPFRPAAFSVWTGIKLADDIPPKKEDEPPPKKEDDKPPPKKDGEVKTGAEMPRDDLMEILCDAVDALWGVQLPEDTNDKSLKKNLLKALMAQIKGENGEGVDDMMTPEEKAAADKKAAGEKTPSAATKPVVQESPPLYMSLEQVNALPENLRQFGQAFLSLQESQKVKDARIEALSKNTIAAATKTRDERVAKLARRLPPAARDKLLARAKSVALSLGDDGVAVDPLADVLDLLEEGTKDIPALLVGGGTMIVEQQQPGDFDGKSMSEERRKQVVEEFERNTGIVGSGTKK